MKRFLLIGVDGAEPMLIDRWCNEGRLPNLASIRDHGRLLPCNSTIPPATFPAWTTCVTGVNPGCHGIVDFTFMPEGEYGIRFTNATHRSAPALWNVVGNAGGRVCVLGVPATYPPEPVNGVMVSGFDSPVCQRIDVSFVYPRDGYRDVAGWPFADFQESKIVPGWHDMAHKKLLEGIAKKERIAVRLLKKEDWDFSMIVFGESDTVSHHFWMYHDPNSPRHQPGPRNAIRDVYERIDQAIGMLIEAAGDVAVGVVSDHGFGGASKHLVHINNWLAQQGYVKYTGDAGDSLIKRAALAVAPPAVRGALFRRFRGAAVRAEGESRIRGIDFPNTRAWSEELPYFPSVRINLKGRDPQGTVSPEDYDVTCDELIAALESWDCIARVHRRADVMDGPHVSRAPDLILELADIDGYARTCVRARGGPVTREISDSEMMGGKERGMNGVHRPTGIFMLDRPIESPNCSIQDVAPTVLSIMDIARPPMDGHSLTDAPDSVTDESNYERTAQDYDAEDAAILESRLRNLGYYE